MKKVIIILVTTILCACESKYITETHCDPEHHRIVVNFMAECGDTVSHCRAEAQRLFCKTKFVKNPNYKED